MALKCGIVGLPNVWKEHLVQLPEQCKSSVREFPVLHDRTQSWSVITVPDERLNKLVRLGQPSERGADHGREIVDIAGLVKGASKGEGT